MVPLTGSAAWEHLLLFSASRGRSGPSGSAPGRCPRSSSTGSSSHLQPTGTIRKMHWKRIKPRIQQGRPFLLVSKFLHIGRWKKHKITLCWPIHIQQTCNASPNQRAGNGGSSPICWCQRLLCKKLYTNEKGRPCWTIGLILDLCMFNV